MTEVNEIEEVAAEVEAVAEAEAAATEEAPKAKKGKGKKKLVIVGALVLIVALAAVGMTAWHNQPSFCGAICHNPMDAYLATYQQEPGQPGFDKWGNDVADTSGMLCVTHAAEGITCLDCHTANFQQQMQEGISWISNSYRSYPNDMFGVAIDERDLKALMAANGGADEEFCLREGCHEVTRAELGALTADYPYNPHDNHYSMQLQCSECHKAHRSSVLFCTNCHSGLKMPDSWLTMTEYGRLDNLY